LYQPLPSKWLIHRLEENRDRIVEKQQHRASNMNGLATAIIFCKMRCLNGAITALSSRYPSSFLPTSNR
jgi:hypothetical protein